jgi:putative transposase
MARPLRLEFPGAVYHIMSRGDRRRDIFADEVDRQKFLDTLGKEVAQQRWRLYAYCLMGNHYHLLVETPEANLVAGMRRLNGVYTQGFNRRHDLVGHVLQGRYKSVIVDRNAYLLELARYIVLNPVRAGLVDHVHDWPWSSYRATAGYALAPYWLSVDAIIGQFGDQAMAAQRVYRDFVRDGVCAPSPWTEIRGQAYLGGEQFLHDIECLSPTGPIKQAVERAKRDLARPDSDDLLEGVANAFGVDPASVCSRRHQSAFQVWVYLLRRAANLSLRDAALRARVSQGRVSQIQRAVQNMEPIPPVANLMHRYKVRG